MMDEISLHILDIVQNSIVAGADWISIRIAEDTAGGVEFIIKDNGCGMNAEKLTAVLNAENGRIGKSGGGRGVALLKAAAEKDGGKIDISSGCGCGTTVSAYFASGCGRLPLGNIAETISTVIVPNDKTEFVYKHTVGKRVFETSTHDLKNIFGFDGMKNPKAVLRIMRYLDENEKALYI